MCLNHLRARSAFYKTFTFDSHKKYKTFPQDQRENGENVPLTSAEGENMSLRASEVYSNTDVNMVGGSTEAAKISPSAASPGRVPDAPVVSRFRSGEGLENFWMVV